MIDSEKLKKYALSDEELEKASGGANHFTSIDGLSYSVAGEHFYCGEKHYMMLGHLWDDKQHMFFYIYAVEGSDEKIMIPYS